MKLNYFNFKPFHGDILMTNDLGRYLFVAPDQFRQIMAGKVSPESELGQRLMDAKMAYPDTDLAFSYRNRFDLREIKGFLHSATALHIFVVTTACNMRCVYCQANNGHDCPHTYMTEEIAERAVDLALQSPEVCLSFEFQGGEPLLNFPVIRHIVEYAEPRKGRHKIEYSLVSNLTLLTDEILDFLEQYHIGISTSLDGPDFVHNRNRMFADGKETFASVVKSIERVRSRKLSIGAIETTTKASLPYPEQIVRTYADLGFDGVFIRPLTPLGKAAMHWDEIGYTAEEFIAFYRKALDEILRINTSGKFFKEAHASILMDRIQGRNMNYMELRSPCGAAMGQMAYYADGNVFTCDEGRMLYEMGQNEFLLGNVHTSTYKELVRTSVCKTVCSSSALETIPSCCDCVYQPYCGTCPVVNYAMTGDIIEKHPRSYRCRIYSGMLDELFRKLRENQDGSVQVLKKWVN